MRRGLLLAAVLIVLVAIAHSYLGERYILRRLFRRADLPHLFGSDRFTRRTLRFAWHITSVAWLGLAGVLVVVAAPGPPARGALLLTVAAAFLGSAAIAVVGSRGRHLSWVVFTAIALLAWFAA
ncbi:MAG: hypothetical protein F9K16_11840 [Thermoanaerobaculia bacterium]|nr:MAG: hypothetical protein F9K16_11840 [Thermoanaerobaculia bacterium]MBZ0101224.1 hypothetical protein [Thermoanaerobaculia bacterium]